MSELEKPDLPWLNVEECRGRDLKGRETGMVEWICYLRFIHLHLESPKDTLFTNTLRNKFVRGTSTSLKNFVVTLL